MEVISWRNFSASFDFIYLENWLNGSSMKTFLDGRVGKKVNLTEKIRQILMFYNFYQFYSLR